MHRRVWGVAIAGILAAGGAVISAGSAGAATPVGVAPSSGAVAEVPPSATGSAPTPIKHVIIFYQENHSFDNVLGALCVEIKRCDGTTTGVLSTGATIALRQSPDVVPGIQHNVTSQQTAINGGAMNGFDLIGGCLQSQNYACFTQYEPSQIPNVAALAKQFVVADHVFELNPIPSWAAHLELVTTTLDGFSGDDPEVNNADWGCQYGAKAEWSATGQPGTDILVPGCVPAPAGSPEVASEPVAVQQSPVSWVPTIMDSLATTKKTWKIYAAPAGQGDYAWSICPTFADCLYTDEATHVVPASQVVSDATTGKLPNFSLLLPEYGPTGDTSQHNDDSMIVGDNWIGQVVQAVEDGPDWNSTAILLTWDDCGCFYDHVAPPAGSGEGVRVPVVIISPWAKQHHTDSTPTSIPSYLAMAEYLLGVPPVTSVDAASYDFASDFNFRQTPAELASNRVAMVTTPEPKSSVAYIAAHPPNPHDPT